LVVQAIAVAAPATLIKEDAAKPATIKERALKTIPESPATGKNPSLSIFTLLHSSLANFHSTCINGK